MKSGKGLLFLLLSLIFLISGCQDSDKGEQRDQAGEGGNFSGVSNMIADRNQARFEGAKNSSASKTNPSVKKRVKGSTQVSKPSPAPKISREDELTSVILYEQEIKIVGSESGRTLADGIAYINKKGQIVRITISKE